MTAKVKTRASGFIFPPLRPSSLTDDGESFTAEFDSMRVRLTGPERERLMVLITKEVDAIWQEALKAHYMDGDGVESPE